MICYCSYYLTHNNCGNWRRDSVIKLKMQGDFYRKLPFLSIFWPFTCPNSFQKICNLDVVIFRNLGDNEQSIKFLRTMVLKTMTKALNNVIFAIFCHLPSQIYAPKMASQLKSNSTFCIYNFSLRFSGFGKTKNWWGSQTLNFLGRKENKNQKISHSAQPILIAAQMKALGSSIPKGFGQEEKFSKFLQHLKKKDLGVFSVAFNDIPAAIMGYEQIFFQAIKYQIHCKKVGKTKSSNQRHLGALQAKQSGSIFALFHSIQEHYFITFKYKLF